MARSLSLAHARDTQRLFVGETQAQLWATFIRLGRVYTQVDWARSEKLAKKFRAEPKACFRNAARVALAEDGLAYVEGFAVVDLRAGGRKLPVEHAWNVDIETHTIIDTTWCSIDWQRDSRPDYFGVVVPRKGLGLLNAVTPGWLSVVLAEIDRNKKQQQ